MKTSIYFLLLTSLMSIYLERSMAQDLAGTWKSERTIAQKKFDYTLYISKTSNNCYAGVEYLQEKPLNKTTKFDKTLGDISNTLDGVSNTLTDVTNIFSNKSVRKKKDAPPIKMIVVKNNFIGSLNNGSFKLAVLGSIETNATNINYLSTTQSFQYNDNAGEPTLTEPSTGVVLKKASTDFPQDYAAYANSSVAISNIHYENGTKEAKIKFNDKGILSFTVQNHTSVSLKNIQLSLQVIEKNAGLVGLDGNRGTFTLEQGKSISPEIDIFSGFNTKSDSVHLAVSGVYGGVRVFDMIFAVASEPFYLTEKSVVNKSSDGILTALQSYYGLNKTNYAPILTKLDQYVLAGNKLAPMWKAIFTTLGKGGYTTNESLSLPLAKKAYPDIMEAARRGDAEAQYLMFYAVGMELTGSPDKNIAGSFLKKSAEAGFIPAIYDYSLFLMRDQQYEESYNFMKSGYDKGVQRAAVIIGFMYQKGHFVAQDVPAAISWYQKGELFNDPDASMQLANLYSRGEGDIEPDAKKAVIYATKSATLKNPIAMNFLAEIYLKGRTGVPKNVIKGLNYYRESANLKDPEAMFSLAYMYLNGAEGVNKDVTMGIFNARKGAESGSGKCMILMAQLYDEGKIDNKKDVIRSRFWANQAREHGYGEKDKTAENAGKQEMSNILSGIDFREQMYVYTDNYGEKYAYNGGSDVMGSLMGSVFGSLMDRYKNQQESINDLVLIHSSGRKVYGGTLTSVINTNLFLKKGQKIKIDSYGNVNLGMLTGVAGPEGAPYGNRSFCIDRNLPLGCVMIGMNNTWTYSGKSMYYTAPADGKLQIAKNDRDYAVNRGYFDVVVTVE